MAPCACPWFLLLCYCADLSTSNEENGKTRNSSLQFKKKRQNQREGEVFHLLVHICNSRGWTSLTAEANNSIRISHISGFIIVFGPVFVASQVCQQDTGLKV